jgi:hypothetical protein
VSKDLKEEKQHTDTSTQNSDAHTAPVVVPPSNSAVVSSLPIDASTVSQAAAKQSDSATLANGAKVLEAAKLDLQKKLSLVAQSVTQADSKLGTSATSGTSAAPKLMMVSWYSEATCAGEVRASSMVSSAYI